MWTMWQLLVPGSDASRVAFSSSGGSSSFSPLGPSRGGSAGIFSFHSLPALLHLGISTTSGHFGVECLQSSLDVSVKLHVSSSCVSSSYSVQVSGGTCQRSTQKFYSSGTVLNMLADIPWQCPVIKYLIVDVSVGKVLKGLPYLHLTLCLLSNVCYADRGSLPQSVRQLWSNFSIYIKGLPAVLEGMGRLVCSTGCTKQCHLCP